MSDNTTQTVEKIDAADLSPMQRELNRELMVAFINARLLERAFLDVRKSTVFYDESKTFSYAWDREPEDHHLETIRANTDIRYWSVGV
ncbi:hypothetical protein SEA_VANLEE_147 [Gordonia phage VanLee]|uniref:Uncharacterized protein n=1 Tax=Gordonia phage VanLee TaxID=2845816 RepID=A0A8F2D9V1_9CAUD|nr:hypothetical protein QEH49_gp143 [Gordonia phage VanLee]QWS68263.1 hypothetical protein SEA_VANLEE_147 [Gordonia phage VanLee]